MTFKDYFHNNKITKEKPLGVKKRHMNSIIRDVSSHPKHPGRTVPHMHRSFKENQKVKSLKNKNNGRYVCNDRDIQEIETEFNLKYDTNKSKNLGNTGITLRYDPVLSAPVLEKI